MRSHSRNTTAAVAITPTAIQNSCCLFLDLETTGLAGGAGTYAFLVGLGWFESGGFRIRQYLFKKDIRTTRMDVRALGLKSEGQPADRVDIVPATS